MNYNLLSLSQTPPLWVPLRYFLTAPLFLIAAALILLFSDATLFATRWNPHMLALTHLVTLGVLGMCMVGAMQQLLPVLAGVVVSRPNRISWVLYLLWAAGTVLLVSGMGMRQPGLSQAGALLLALAVLGFVVIAGLALARSGSRHATIPAMALALLGLLIAVTIVSWLLWRFDGHTPLAHPLTRLHIGWSGLGWIALLLIGVAYQVVPMFQLTSPYPVWLRRLLAPALFFALLLWSVWPWLSLLPLGLLLAFAVQTLWLQNHRRRHTHDATLDFWRLAMLSLLSTGVVWLVYLIAPDARLEMIIGVLFLLGFALSAVNGMLYKIVPFLVWLHMNNRLQQGGQWQGKVPTMNQIISPLAARNQLGLHLLALALLLLAIWQGSSPWMAGVAWLVNGGMLFWNLGQGVRVFYSMVKH